MEEIIDDTASQTSDSESTTESVDTQGGETQTDDLTKKNKQLFERAKKAETEAKELKARLAEVGAKAVEQKPTTKAKYSLEEIDEISALSSIPREDRAEVVQYAEMKGIRPSEALNTPLIKTFLREAEEQRKSALASNTGTAKRGSSGTTDEAILEKYSNGNLPEDAKEMDRLAEARMNQKLKNRNSR